MIPYSQFCPTACDQRGLGLDDRQEWLVLGVSQTRDSGVLDRCNFAVALESLGGESDTVEVHRFGHWGPGWFEVILVAPGSPAEREANAIEAALADYPVLADDRLSAMADEEAREAWSHERTRDRLEYIRRHRSEHGFRSFADLLGCARGRHFAGDALSYLGGC